MRNFTDIKDISRIDIETILDRTKKEKRANNYSIMEDNWTRKKRIGNNKLTNTIKMYRS